MTESDEKLLKKGGEKKNWQVYSLQQCPGKTRGKLRRKAGGTATEQVWKNCGKIENSGGEH